MGRGQGARQALIGPAARSVQGKGGGGEEPLARTFSFTGFRAVGRGGGAGSVTPLRGRCALSRHWPAPRRHARPSGRRLRRSGGEGGGQPEGRAQARRPPVSILCGRRLRAAVTGKGGRRPQPLRGAGPARPCPGAPRGAVPRVSRSGGSEAAVREGRLPARPRPPRAARSPGALCRAGPCRPAAGLWELPRGEGGAGRRTGRSEGRAGRRGRLRGLALRASPWGEGALCGEGRAPRNEAAPRGGTGSAHGVAASALLLPGEDSCGSPGGRSVRAWAGALGGA